MDIGGGGGPVVAMSTGFLTGGGGVLIGALIGAAGSIAGGLLSTAAALRAQRLERFRATYLPITGAAVQVGAAADALLKHGVEMDSFDTVRMTSSNALITMTRTALKDASDATNWLVLDPDPLGLDVLRQTRDLGLAFEDLRVEWTSVALGKTNVEQLRTKHQIVVKQVLSVNSSVNQHLESMKRILPHLFVSRSRSPANSDVGE